MRRPTRIIRPRSRWTAETRSDPRRRARSGSSTPASACRQAPRESRRTRDAATCAAPRGIGEITRRLVQAFPPHAMAVAALAVTQRAVREKQHASRARAPSPSATRRRNRDPPVRQAAGPDRRQRIPARRATSAAPVSAAISCARLGTKVKPELSRRVRQSFDQIGQRAGDARLTGRRQAPSIRARYRAASSVPDSDRATARRRAGRRRRSDAATAASPPPARHRRRRGARACPAAASALMASTRMTASAASRYGSSDRPSVPPSSTCTSSGASYRSSRRATAAAPTPSSPSSTLPRPRTRSGVRLLIDLARDAIQRYGPGPRSRLRHPLVAGEDRVHRAVLLDRAPSARAL